MRSRLILGSIIVTQVAWALGFGLFTLMLAETIAAPWLLYLWVSVALVISSGMLSYYVTRYLADSLHAFEVGLLNFKDNDFSVTLPSQNDSQLNRLCELFNESALSLREQRQFIYQREMLLDKVIQSSPNVMYLLDDSNKVVYANDAARHFFNKGVAIAGFDFAELCQALSPEFTQALNNPKGGLFNIEHPQQDNQTWHLSRGRFQLNGQYHHLYLLKQMTQELSRQEVAVWKKVIRIISHELNNSLAPIASMVKSGRKLTESINDPKLELIFDTIEDRSEHLSQFIFSYARFAKLPMPVKSVVELDKLMQQLQQHYSFTLDGKLPDTQCQFDVIQIEQVLLNLLKNAHEAGGDNQAIAITVTIEHRATNTTLGEYATTAPFIIFRIKDRGPGMSSDVLQQALLPFYSTKQKGTGLGLALSKEIIEAHEGQISLNNRDKGGLQVTLALPLN
ncbi:PAS domain-containing sensor histidine kinase [Paraferrimonas sp. SM1919]|uniref:sensor histidine kinase n=1 Tax=Paraferrimonas sp. SM1919 TaxID=2662263 RepID=UPI0013D6F4ED|nr:ATP-binding protein [Paraferrimonas sp. SM1919]